MSELPVGMRDKKLEQEADEILDGLDAILWEALETELARSRSMSMGDAALIGAAASIEG